MNTTSTTRVARYRERQREAGRKRVTLYIDGDAQRKLERLAGDKPQSAFIEELLHVAYCEIEG